LELLATEPGCPGEQQAPPLDELRLHQGTVWPWNRAVYDPADGGHLRIEMRFLPAGPTVTDMMANAAFMIGLTRWLASQDQRWTYALPFERADHSFYRSAQYGLAAELSWPLGPPQARGQRGVRSCSWFAVGCWSPAEFRVSSSATPAGGSPKSMA